MMPPNRHMSIAEPSPCPTRDATSCVMLEDRAADTEPTRNRVTPAAYIGRNPTRSATADSGSMQPTTVRLYASTTHTDWLAGIPNDAEIAGKATLDMVESKTVIVMPRIITATAQYRRGVGSPSAVGESVFVRVFPAISFSSAAASSCRWLPAARAKA